MSLDDVTALAVFVDALTEDPNDAQKRKYLLPNSGLIATMRGWQSGNFPQGVRAWR